MIAYRNAAGNVIRLDDWAMFEVVEVPAQGAMITPTPRFGIGIATQHGLKFIIELFTIRQSAEAERNRILMEIESHDTKNLIINSTLLTQGPATGTKSPIHIVQ